MAGAESTPFRILVTAPHGKVNSTGEVNGCDELGDPLSQERAVSICKYLETMFADVTILAATLHRSEADLNRSELYQSHSRSETGMEQDSEFFLKFNEWLQDTGPGIVIDVHGYPEDLEWNRWYPAGNIPEGAFMGHEVVLLSTPVDDDGEFPEVLNSELNKKYKVPSKCLCAAGSAPAHMLAIVNMALDKKKHAVLLEFPYSRGTNKSCDFVMPQELQTLVLDEDALAHNVALAIRDAAKSIKSEPKDIRRYQTAYAMGLSPQEKLHEDILCAIGTARRKDPSSYRDEREIRNIVAAFVSGSWEKAVRGRSTGVGVPKRGCASPQCLHHALGSLFVNAGLDRPGCTPGALCTLSADVKQTKAGPS